MTTRTDPLVQKREAVRPYYALGVLLGADDFTDEQSYHRGRLARALAYLHGSGTVAGLAVAVEPGTPAQEERLLVQPGLAVDRLGRLIEVTQPLCIRLGRWFAQQAPGLLARRLYSAPIPGVDLPEGDGAAYVVADVFVRFVICEAEGKTPAFTQSPFEPVGGIAPARLRDSAEVIGPLLRQEETLPVPASVWDGLDTNSAAAFRTALHERILAGWREGTAHGSLGGLEPEVVHAPGQDTTSLWLARVAIPVTPPAAEGEAPARVEGAPPVVGNLARRFVYAPNALAELLIG